MNIFDTVKRMIGMDATGFPEIKQNNFQPLSINSYMERFDDYAFSSNVSSVESGMKSDVVFTCIKRVSDTIAMTPFPVFKRSETGRDKFRTHPLYKVLNKQANRDSTAYTWRQVTTIHLLGWGNAFSHIERNNRGEVIGLHPMHPADVKVEGRAEDGELVYKWTDRNKNSFLFRASEVLHIKGFSYDGIFGLSPVMQMRQLVGLDRVRSEFQARFYENGAQLGGVIVAKDGLTDEQLERYRLSFETLYKGAKNSGKILLLEGTQEFHAIGINPKDAEYIASVNLTSSKIAAMYGVPAPFLNMLDGVNRATTEALFREFLAMGLNTIFTNIESEVNIKLLSDLEQEIVYAEFNRESLIQADTATLIASLSQEVLSCLLTPNEGRAMLNLNSKEGGDVLLAPVNMVPINLLGKGAVSFDMNGGAARAIRPPEPLQQRLEQPTTKRSAAGRKRIPKAYKGLLHDAYERIGKRERQDVAKSAKKNLRDADSFSRFLDEYYAEDSAFADYIRKTLQPIMDSLSGSLQSEVEAELGKNAPEDSNFVREYIATLVNRYAASSRRQLQGILDEPGDEDVSELIEKRLSEWDDGTSTVNPNRAEKESENESHRMTNALTRVLFIAAGVTALVWRTNGEGCPICSELDGKVVGIERQFVDEGEQVGTMKSSGKVFTGPLHGGCQCSVDPQ